MTVENDCLILQILHMDFIVRSFMMEESQIRQKPAKPAEILSIVLALDYHRAGRRKNFMLPSQATRGAVQRALLSREIARFESPIPSKKRAYGQWMMEK